MRKLASIQKIKHIKPIEGADSIEIAHILGWQCVVKKGEFKTGDYGVYFEIDSFLPLEERYDFLIKSSFRKNPLLGEGIRIKTVKLRGEISQGLVLPIEIFPEIIDVTEGSDVTEILGVRKWEIPESVGSMGTSIGTRPFGIPKTDETRIQSTELMIEHFTGKPYYISTKMDGTSCTIYCKNGKIGVCGRNEEYKEEESSPMWSFVKKNNIEEKLRKLNRDVAIQGEFCGPGIQSNHLNLMEPELYVFDLFFIEEREYAPFDVFINVMQDLNIITVPIEEEGDSFNYDLTSLLERSKGKYQSGKNKEGIVVRLKNYSDRGQFEKASFKVINNDFLLKEK